MGSFQLYVLIKVDKNSVEVIDPQATIQISTETRDVCLEIT